MDDVNDVIVKDGIVNVLEHKGFYKDKDFIFVGNNSETDFSFDGVPMYRIAEYQNNTTSFYLDELKRDVTLDIINSFSMRKPGVWGQTSSNNGVYAVYVPKQGFVFTINPEIKQLMEKEFKFQDTHFGIPLSNGAQFRDKKLQTTWKTMLFMEETKKLKKKNIEQNAVRAANNLDMDK